MSNRTLLATIVLLVAALAACGETDPTVPVVDGDAGDDASGQDGDDPAGSWVLVDAQPTVDIPDGVRITLTVTAQDDGTWQVGGSSACNSYGGTVTTDGGAWRAEGFGWTDMACEEPRMAAEQAYLAAFTDVDTWARPSADELALTGPDVALLYERLSPVPTADLVETTWVLDGLVHGAGADSAVSSTVADADDATLRLRADGTVQASTGCRTFEGEWIETGDEILFTTFGQRDDSPNVAPDGTTSCSEQLVDQEDHVLSVLGDGFRVEIDGRSLTLTSRDGLGLVYRAADES